MPFNALLKALALLLFLPSLPVLNAADTPIRRKVLQPVHEYQNLNETVAPPVYGIHILNGFLSYTHIGTDFGFLGPGELHFDCVPGGICAEFPKNPDGWGGVWHNLNGLAREHRALDLRACYPSIIASAFQPRVVGVQAVVSGSGLLKLEFRASNDGNREKALETSEWAQTFPLAGDPIATQTLTAAIDPDKIAETHFLNWVAESGADLCVDSLSLEVELPPVDFPTYVFLSSYAKLARCYSEQTGFVRDRAHTTPDVFNNVSATGMFALATAAASQLGIVEQARAREVVKRIGEAVLSLPRKHGLLPHFVKQVEGKWLPLSGSEYSTVDTALCLIPLRIAAMALQDQETAARVLEMLRAVAVSTLRDADGYVIHGLKEDGQPLESIWRDWGGETALVLMMQRIAAGPSFVPKMDENGRTHRGIGFISELPAMFLPQFNTHMRAHAGLVDWRAYRQGRLAEQKAYFPSRAPKSFAAEFGLYGLSAGEAANGKGYHAGGVEDPEEKLIFPHYILMSAQLEADPRTTYDLLGKMEARGWLTPWGLVEHVKSDGRTYLPMIGSLNASFEAMGAYHLLMRHRNGQDEIYQAAIKDPVMQDAIKAVFE
jgi:hypothetical protein